MKKPQKLSKSMARSIAIRAQGLSRKNQFGLGSTGALAMIEHLGYVQIDTISVIERAHHHVFWSRVSDYRGETLERLMTGDRKIFEYWNHAASYLPLSDYRFAMPRMRAIQNGTHPWFKNKPKKEMEFVLNRIKSEGPLQVKDFDAPKSHRAGPWFQWKPAKRALEQLFMEGKLCIAGRKGFQKVYDLTERVLPKWVDQNYPSDHEIGEHYIRRATRALGIASSNEMHYLVNREKKNVNAGLGAMLDRGEIQAVKIDGSDETYYLNPDCLPEASPPVVNEEKSSAKNIFILSPFDNLVIQRRRLKFLFDFDYTIECYVPKEKRKYGYFCLPILFGDEFIGRIDAKTDRKKKVLIVQSLFLEPSVDWGDELRELLKAEIEKFSQFNGCETVQYPEKLKKRRSLKKASLPLQACW